MSKDRKNWFHRLNKLAMALVLVVVVLGAFVRLSDAGLGCPDWPGCYGHVGVPDEHHEVQAANAAYPDRPVEPAKAWKEMIHRYAASILGLVILLMALIAWWRRANAQQPLLTPFALLALVMFQGALGMWTVTELLSPAIVSSHLAGGFATMGLTWWLLLRDGNYFVPVSISNAFRLRRSASLALGVLIVQIMLGAWTSTNYAAAVCPDFPTCQGQWLPDMDFGEGFTLWRPLGVDYEGGVLEGPARTAIHVTHRIGAVIASLIILVLAIRLLGERDPTLRGSGMALLGALLLQLAIGIFMVLWQFPLPIATAHNAGAAILLLALLATNHSVRAVPMLRYR